MTVLSSVSTGRFRVLGTLEKDGQVEPRRSPSPNPRLTVLSPDTLSMGTAPRGAEQVPQVDPWSFSLTLLRDQTVKESMKSHAETKEVVVEPKKPTKPAAKPDSRKASTVSVQDKAAKEPKSVKPKKSAPPVVATTPMVAPSSTPVAVEPPFALPSVSKGRFAVQGVDDAAPSSSLTQAAPTETLGNLVRPFGANEVQELQSQPFAAADPLLMPVVASSAGPDAPPEVAAAVPAVATPKAEKNGIAKSALVETSASKASPAKKQEAPAADKVATVKPLVAAPVPDPAPFALPMSSTSRFGVLVVDTKTLQPKTAAMIDAETPGRNLTRPFGAVDLAGLAMAPLEQVAAVDPYLVPMLVAASVQETEIAVGVEEDSAKHKDEPPATKEERASMETIALESKATQVELTDEGAAAKDQPVTELPSVSLPVATTGRFAVLETENTAAHSVVADSTTADSRVDNLASPFAAAQVDELKKLAHEQVVAVDPLPMATVSDTAAPNENMEDAKGVDEVSPAPAASPEESTAPIEVKPTTTATEEALFSEDDEMKEETITPPSTPKSAVAIEPESVAPSTTPATKQPFSDHNNRGAPSSTKAVVPKATDASKELFASGDSHAIVTSSSTDTDVTNGHAGSAEPLSSPVNSRPPTTAKLLVLISHQSYDRHVRVERAFTILSFKNIEYETIDGADPANKERRNELFGISGLRAKYPQFFLLDGDQTVFWGDWERFEHANDDGTLVKDLGVGAAACSVKETSKTTEPVSAANAPNGEPRVVEPAPVLTHTAASSESKAVEPAASTKASDGGPKAAKVETAPTSKKSWASIAATAKPKPVQVPRAAVAEPVVEEAKASVPPMTKKKLTVLISGQSLNREVVANQERAFAMLSSNGIKYETIDGASPSNKNRRNELFGISGLRAQYPQFFVLSGNQLIFWGDWKRFESCSEAGTLSQDLGVSVDTSVGSKGIRSVSPIAVAAERAPGAASPATDDATASSPTEKKLLLLVSNQSFDREVIASQEWTFAILSSKGIKYETLDGADPSNKDRRNELFTISGVRAKYPQFFLVKGDKTSFWGDWQRFESANEAGTLMDDIGIVAKPESGVKANSRSLEPAAPAIARVEAVEPFTNAKSTESASTAARTNHKSRSFDLSSKTVAAHDGEPSAGAEQSSTAAKDVASSDSSGKNTEDKGGSSGKDRGASKSGGPVSAKSGSASKSKQGLASDGTSQVDITIYGATSFVAKHVLSYLTQVSLALPRDLKVTLAGRDAAKLDALKDSIATKMTNLVTITPDFKSKCLFDVVVAESMDDDALGAMAKKTKVVLNCAGPFAKYSSGVVKACALYGADYVDITGEVHWVSEMRLKYGDLAKKSGARIISFCGFDSIPSDLAVFAAVRVLQQEAKNKTVEIKQATTWHSNFGPMNGGTLHTAIDFPIRLSSFLHRVPYLMEDPLALVNPALQEDPAMQSTRNRFALSEWLNQLPSLDSVLMYGMSLPFFMAVINAKVVHASAVALKYGPNFTYRERWVPVGYSFTRKLKLISIVPAVIAQIFLLVVMAIVMTPVLGKKIADWLLPPGTGASDRTCQSGYADVYAEVSTAKNANGLCDKASCHLEFTGDPGNWVTAQCVTESALSLVLNKAELPDRSQDGFGTPAELLGPVLFQRLQATTVRPMHVTTSVRKGVGTEAEMHLSNRTMSH